MGLTKIEKEGIETLINNNADNRVITGSGTANTLEGEATLTYANPTLEINTDTSPYGALTLNGNSGGLIQFEDNEVSKWQIFGDSAINIYDDVNNASRLYIDSAGKVGIGATSPTNSFHLHSADATLLITNSDGVNQADAGYIRIQEVPDSLQGAFIHYDGSANKLHIGCHNADDTNTANDRDDITIIRSTGKVGFNNTDPSAAIEVTFDSGGSAPSSGTAPEGIAISYGTSDGKNGGIWFSPGFGDDQGISGIAGTRTSGYQTDLRFYTNNSNSARAFTERMRIDASGNCLASKSFVSKKSNDASVNTSTSSGFTANTFNVVLGQDVLESQSTYLITFFWNHQGSGQPFESYGSFTFSPGGTNPGSTGAMGPNFVPLQGAHTEQGVSKYWTFRYYSSTGQHTHGLQAAFNQSLNDANGNGQLSVHAVKLADTTTI